MGTLIPSSLQISTQNFPKSLSMLTLLEAFQVWYCGTNSSSYLETQIQWLNICLNVVEKIVLCTYWNSRIYSIIQKGYLSYRDVVWITGNVPSLTNTAPACILQWGTEQIEDHKAGSLLGLQWWKAAALRLRSLLFKLVTNFYHDVQVLPTEDCAKRKIKILAQL